MTEFYSKLLLKTASYDPSAVLLYKIAAGKLPAKATYSVVGETMPDIVKAVQAAPLPDDIARKAVNVMANAADKTVKPATQDLVGKFVSGGKPSLGNLGTSITGAANVTAPYKDLAVNADKLLEKGLSVGSVPKEKVSVIKNIVDQVIGGVKDAGNALKGEASRLKTDVTVAGKAMKAGDKTIAKGALKDVLKNPITVGTGLGVAGAGSITGQAALLYNLLKDKSKGIQGLPEGLGAGAVAMPVIYGGLSLLPGAKRRRVMNAILAIMGSGATTAAVLASKNKA